VNDVLEEADAQGVNLTRLEAEDFLRKVEKKLKGAMINIGWSVLARELKKRTHGENRNYNEQEQEQEREVQYV